MVPGEVMSSLRRSLEGVAQVLLDELRRAAAAEGPDGVYFLEHADITADYIDGQEAIRVGLSYRNKEIWARKIPMSRYQVEGVKYSGKPAVTDDKFRETISNTMRAHLNLVAQLHYARLAQVFPDSIADVALSYDPETMQKTLCVKFKNGHVAEGPESEAKSEVFLARCAMLYDLPSI
jgi:hypothetical protein